MYSSGRLVTLLKLLIPIKSKEADDMQGGTEANVQMSDKRRDLELYTGPIWLGALGLPGVVFLNVRIEISVSKRTTK